MLQVSDEDEVVVHYEIGDEIEAQICNEAKGVYGPGHDSYREGKPDITDNDLPIFLGLEEGRIGVEVTPWFVLVL